MRGTTKTTDGLRLTTGSERRYVVFSVFKSRPMPVYRTDSRLRAGHRWSIEASTYNNTRWVLVDTDLRVIDLDTGERT